MALCNDIQEILACQDEIKAMIATLMTTLGDVATLEELCEKVDAQDECLAEIKAAVICEEAEGFAVEGLTATGFSAQAGAFEVGDTVTFANDEGEVLGTAVITDVSETKYAISENTVAEANLAAVATASKR
jgi:hypothetical protein